MTGEGAAAMPARVVTISATYGAGGSVVGPALAQRLGLPFADRLTPAKGKAAVATVERATEAERAEEPRNSFLQSLALLSDGWNIPAPADVNELPAHVQHEVEASLQELLDTGGAVVLGRAA